MRPRSLAGIAGLAALALGSGATDARAQPVITTTTADGVRIYGELYFGSLGEDAPLVLLFHQGGANGRGEYGPLASWLNGEGFRAIAWDQRRGGPRLGSSNRTVAGLGAESPGSYCDAYSDLQAALDYVTEHDLAERVIAWGSSYSATLVFRLAADNPDHVAAVIAFSPAAGDPMAGCQAHDQLDRIRAPILALRPDSEMELPGPVEQRSRLTAGGVEFHVVESGAHGSSMLLDERTGSDMSAARAFVASWLRGTAH